MAHDSRKSHSAHVSSEPFAQEAHAEAENLRQQINVLRDFAIFTLDRSGHVATWNEGAERFLGYRADEILGREYSRFFPPEKVAAGMPARELQAAETTDHFEYEGWRVRKDGSQFWATIILTTLRDADRNVIGFGKVVRDDSERKHSVEQFRQAIEAAPTGMLLMDDKGGIVLVNEQIEKLFGYPRHELMGQRVEILVPERYRAHHPEYRKDFFGDPKVRPMGKGRELYGLRKDGSEIPVEIGLNPVSTRDGNFVLGSVIDIADRKRAMEQFRLAIEASPTGMLMMDEAGNIVMVNVQIEKLFGYRREELLGQKIEKLVPQRFRDRHPDYRRSFFAKPQARAMGAGRDLYGMRSDGTEVPIEIGLNPLTTSEGNFVLSSVVDITERMRADREREDLLDQLRVLNADLERRVNDRTSELTATLREREVLLQEIHHRVKNNLQVISSLVNMQCRQVGDDASRNALEECQTRVQAIALIHEKLYQSRDYSRVPFSEYARGLAGNVFHALGVSKDLVALELDFEELSIGVDKAIPCGLVLNELITNSLKHAFPDSRRGKVRVTLRREGSGDAVLSVGDDGVGMPPDFDLHKSTSLGMSLVSMLVEQLGGAVEVRRTHGTEICVRFPIEGMP